MGNRVLVSGAGVAGLAVAYWLDRHGFEVTVVERAPSPRDAGYKVDVRGTALEVLDSMGLLEPARSHNTGIVRAAYVDGRGRVVARLDGDLFGGRTTGDVEILRGDLTRLLLAAVRDRVDIRFGESISSLHAEAEHVDVRLHGGGRDAVDIVVGADGLHSNVRAMAFELDPAQLAPLGHYVAAWSVPNLPGLDHEEIVFAEPRRTVNVYHASGQDHANAIALFASPPLEYDRHAVAWPRLLLRQAFDGAGWRVGDLLDAADQAPDLYFDAMTQVRLRRWSAGRVVLVGDAAYASSPASGQATSMALVGAYVLAGELAAGASPEAALGAYEAELRPYVARNQALAHSNLRGMVLPSRGAVWAQTRMLGLLPRVPGGRRLLIDPVVRAIHDAATAVMLKPY